MKKSMLGFVIAIPIVIMITMGAIASILSIQISNSNSSSDEPLENLVFEGEELNDKVTIEMSGDASATLEGKMSKDRKSFTVRWENDEGEVVTGDAKKVVEAAESLLGTPYRKLDCGHMVQKVYKMVGIKIPGNTHKFVEGTFGKTIKVGKKNGAKFRYSDVKDMLKPGDIFVWGEGSTWRMKGGGRYSHVGLYIGNGQIIHSTSTKKDNGVKKRKMGNQKLYRVIRVIDNDTSSVEPMKILEKITTPVKAGSNKTAKATWKALKSVGCTDEAAAGILGNIQQECSFNAAYDSGGDYGLFNMNQGRAKEMKKYASDRNKSWTDPQMQVEWCDKKNAAKQFKTYSGQKRWYTYSNGTKTWWRKKISWNQFKKLDSSNYTQFLDPGLDNAKDNGKDNNAVDLATHIFCNVFERAGIPRMDKRRKYATNWYKEFVGKYPTGGGSGFTSMEFTGHIDGEKLTLEGNIDGRLITAEGTFKKWSKKETHKKVKTHNEIYAIGGENGAGDGASTGELAWPLKGSGTIWRGWGVWTNTSGAGHYHGGLDIAQSEGRPVYASDGGEVVGTTSLSNGKSLGISVTIKHSKYMTRYQHLRSENVHVGQKVNKGQKIGTVGGSYCGNLNGCGVHLHFEVWRNKVYSKCWKRGKNYVNEYAPSWGCGEHYRGSTVDPLQVLPKNGKFRDMRGFRKNIGKYKGDGHYGNQAQGAKYIKNWE